MDYDAARSEWSCECWRCGGKFRVTEPELIEGVQWIPCETCSYAVHLAYAEEAPEPGGD